MPSDLWGPVLIASFVACSVEVIEMVIIVVGVGTARGWRATIVGGVSGLVVLAAVVGGLGQALTLVPIDPLRVVIGALLLTFGLQWLTQGVIGVAADGFTGGGEEEAEAGAGDAGGGFDWTAWLLAFKGVTLEGLEVAFIVIAFGASGGRSGDWLQAYAGAAAAFVIVGVLGFLSIGTLEQVPGRSLKFGVGGLISTFGTFWAMEGVGVGWPRERLSLLWLYLLYLGTTLALAWLARRGLIGPRPMPSPPPDAREGEPVAAAPVTRGSVLRYQRIHGLEETGIVDAGTQAAIRADRAEGGAAPPADRLLDAADPHAVARFQRRHGLPASGVVDDATRGALRVAALPGMVDGADEDDLRRFQRAHDLEETGRPDEPTRVAWRAVVREGAARGDGAADPVAAHRDLDVTSRDSVRAFQRSLGLDDDGVVGDVTRGAILAMRTRLAALGDAPPDPAPWAEGSAGTEPDPLDPDQIARLQRRYGLGGDGVIDEGTRRALRWEHEHLLGVDVASAESVRAFQRAHALREDGVVGPLTQAAMRAARVRRRARDGDGDSGHRYGDAERHAAGFGLALDPADAESVRRAQRRAGIAADGIIGPRTRAALRALRAELTTAEGSEP